MIARAAALHPFENASAGVLQGNIDVVAQRPVLGDSIEQPLRHAVRVEVEKTDPAGVFYTRQAVQQSRQAVAQAQIFAVAGRVLADQANLTNPR